MAFASPWTAPGRLPLECRFSDPADRRIAASASSGRTCGCFLIVRVGLSPGPGPDAFTRAKLASITGESSAKRKRDRVYAARICAAYDTMSVSDRRHQPSAAHPTSRPPAFVANRPVRSDLDHIPGPCVLGIMLSLTSPSGLSVDLIPRSRSCGALFPPR